MNALLLTLLLAVQSDSVPLYTNLGNYHHTISTTVARAQQYFNQGLRLAYGFNHEEAIRSFREAARLDEKCAMCWWGVAYAYGPNINLPMDSAANGAAVDALAKASALAQHASVRERAYIAALAARYGAKAGAAGDSAYMRAMQALARKYPSDLNAATLAAEARMLLRPWNYWKADGSAQPGTRELVATLERVIRTNPNHPGACHFYIHAVEAAEPHKAVPCAERLGGLMPGAGHLVHMPAHIYIRVGRWNDAIEANHHAVHADEQYIAGEKGSGERKSGIYPLVYYPHNHHFLAFAATMAGRSQLALEHARAVRANIPVEAAEQFVILQPLVAYPYLALLTFGKWDDVIAEPMPAPSLRVVTALAAYAKGVAHAAKGERAAADQQLDTVRAVAREIDESAGNVDLVLEIALHALMGELAQRSNDLAAAEQHFRAALDIEKGMLYNEPPDWYYPMQHSLGVVLIEQGKAADAEQLYLDDLKKYAENVWSLKGLALALHAQDKHADAAAVEARLATAAAAADIELKHSRH